MKIQLRELIKHRNIEKPPDSDTSPHTNADLITYPSNLTYTAPLINPEPLEIVAVLVALVAIVLVFAFVKRRR